MKEQWVTITLKVPLKAIDFRECGDGCGQIDGLGYAKFKNVKIERFGLNDVQAAEEAMKAALGHEEPRLNMYDRQADLRAFAAQEKARVMGDGFSKARDAR